MRALPGSRARIRTPPARTREEIAGEQRRRILKATGELVGEKGYLGFRVEELLSRAQVGLPTVRKHFGDKQDCYLALLDLSFEEARRRLSEVLAHLAERFDRVPSVSTIWRVLRREGLASPQPQKRPRSALIRFCAELPNEMWQADVTH